MSENLESFNKEKAAIEDDLKIHLFHYGKKDPSLLKKISTYKNWKSSANKEIEQRRFGLPEKILESLDIDQVKAIASGEVDITALATEVEERVTLILKIKIRQKSRKLDQTV